MARKGPGWHNESRRHSLARRGIRTANSGMVAYGRVKTISKEVFRFDELPPEVQDKILDKMRFINVDYPWWDFTVEDFMAIAKENGLDFKHLYFDLDRNAFIYMDKPYVSDEKKFLKWLGEDYDDIKNKLVKEGWLDEDEELYIGIDTIHYAGSRAENSVYLDNVYDAELTDALQEKLEKWRKWLEEEYEYLTSDESIIGTIEANDYEFTKDGEMW